MDDMKICYRDDIGLVSVTIDTRNTTGIGFDGRYAYFSDVEGVDYLVETKNIVWIGVEV